MSRKSVPVRKSLLRNREKPLAAVNYQVSNCFEDARKEKVRFILPERLPEAPPKSSGSVNKFAKPELHTTLKMRQMMEAQKPEKVAVSPTVLAAAKEEISKKLNFGRYQRVYRNLVPVNVNDLVVEREEKPQPKKRSVKILRDPVPKLEDYLKPIPPLIYEQSFMQMQTVVKPPKKNLAKENSNSYRYQLAMLKHFDHLY